MEKDKNELQFQTVQELLGEEEFQKFLTFAKEFPNQPESVRINSLRYEIEEYIQFAEDKGISFKKVQGSIPDAYYVFMNGSARKWWNQERLLGNFYSQGNASMIPPLFMTPPNEPDTDHLKILDMCASPGSKTTQMGALMKNKGLLVANDYKSHRLYALHRNLQVFGISNAVVTQLDGRWIASRWPKRFDRILLDAPCSGTGSNRKNLFSNRNEEAIKRFQHKQKGLLSSAIGSLNNEDNSFIIYSTCSLLPHENELILQSFIDKNLITVEPLNLGLLYEWKIQPGLQEWQGENLSPQLENAVRINPHWNDSDAFFVAKLKIVGE
jgi:16S rRNA (cytosine1407-C5)-methyltransferase